MAQLMFVPLDVVGGGAGGGGAMMDDLPPNSRLFMFHAAFFSVSRILIVSSPSLSCDATTRWGRISTS
jgi:hypothetical protein